MTQPFWKRKKLTEMNRKEWESLCDGCAQCCLHKIEDEETRKIYYTYIACYLLELNHCRCTSYGDKSQKVPSCINLTQKHIRELSWLPHTCAYRKLTEGEDLEWWHPLVSGNPETVHQAGISVRGKAVSENNVHPDDWNQFVINDE